MIGLTLCTLTLLAQAGPPGSPAPETPPAAKAEAPAAPGPAKAEAPGPPGAAEAAPTTPSYAVADDARAFINAYGRTDLVDDATFVKALRKLADSPMSAESKADAFMLMQDRIGWLFAGMFPVFPGQNYATTSAQVITTYFQYQQQLKGTWDVGPLLALFKDGRGKHPFRASNALLLAVILNPRMARPAVRAGIDPKAIAAASVPAIDLHNLSRAVALTGDPKVVEALLELLPDTPGEESREDLIVATSIYGVESLRDKVEAFVREELPKRFDRGVVTALQVLARDGPTPHFVEFCKSIRPLAQKPADLERLRALWASGFRDDFNDNEMAAKGMVARKVWDGMTLHLVTRTEAWMEDGRGFRHRLDFSDPSGRPAEHDAKPIPDDASKN